MKIQNIIAVSIFLIGLSLSVVMAVNNYEEPCVPGMKLVRKMMCCNLNETICWEGDVEIYIGNEKSRERIEEYNCRIEYHTDVIFCGGEGFNLSEKTHNECYAEKNSWIISEEDVKEFIKQIKATMLFKPSPSDRGEYIIWLGREINKLAGNKLA